MLRISELRNKDVIDARDGRRLGFIRDIDIDLLRGRIEAVIIPDDNRFFTLFVKSDETVLSWRQIKKIGVDVILVEADRYRPAPERAQAERRQNEAPPLVRDDAFANDDFLL